MLKYIFFFFGVFGFIYELWIMGNLRKLFNFKKKNEDILKKRKEGEDKSSLIKSLGDTTCSFLVCALLYAFWSIVGIFSSQWILFTLLLLIGFVSTRFTRSKTISFESYSTIVFIDALISAGLVGFAIINAIHLHIPLLKTITDYFK